MSDFTSFYTICTNCNIQVNVNHVGLITDMGKDTLPTYCPFCKGMVEYRPGVRGDYWGSICHLLDIEINEITLSMVKELYSLWHTERMTYPKFVDYIAFLKMNKIEG